MSKSNPNVITVMSIDEFSDAMFKSRTDSSTDMNWERSQIMDSEGSDWDSVIQTDTVPSYIAKKPCKNKSNEPSMDTSNFLPHTFSSGMDSNDDEMTKLIIQNEEDLNDMYKMTPELTCVCMKLIWDFLNTDGKTAEEYVHDKILSEFSEMSEWEIIVCIEVFYSFLEKIQVLDLVLKGFNRSLRRTELNCIEEFQKMQMKVLIYLIFFESVRIGLGAMSKVLINFSTQNFRKLYFYLGAQLRFDSPLKLAIFSLTGEDYFNRLIKPNLPVAEKLTRKVPRILHYLKTNNATDSCKTFLANLEMFLSSPPSTKQCMQDLGTTDDSDSTLKSRLPSTVSQTDLAALIDKDEQIDSNAEVPFEEEMAAYEKDMEEYLHLMNPLGKVEKEEGNDQDIICKPKIKKKPIVYKEPNYRGKQTITTILRERQRLKNLMVKENFGDYETVLRELQEKQKEAEIKAAEKKEEERQRQKLLLISKLSYHKAIAATRDALEKRQEIGQEVRNESEQLKSAVEEQKLKELGEKQLQAKMIAEETERIRIAAEVVKKQKQAIANKVKKEKEKLLQKSQNEELAMQFQRLDNIKKIQACHGMKNYIYGHPLVQHGIVLRKVENEKNAVRLRISRMEQKEKLMQNKKKIEEVKQNRLNNIANAQNDIEVFRMTHNVKRSMEQQLNKMQSEIKIEPEEDEEISKIKEELEKVKNLNKSSKYPNSWTNPSAMTLSSISPPNSK